MLRFLFCALLLLPATPSVSALSWQELENEIKITESGGAPDPVTLQRLSDIVYMLVILVNAEHESHPDHQLMCPPQDQPFDLDSITSLMRKHVRNVPKLHSKSVQEVLLYSMQSEFSCPRGAATKTP